MRTNVKRSLSLHALLALVLLAGCSARSLELDGEVVRQRLEPDGGVDDGRWDCLDALEPLPGIEPPPPGIAYIVQIFDSLQPDRAPRSLRVDVCLLSDYNCAQPLPITVSEPDPMRPELKMVVLPYGFEGYLRLAAPGYLQTEYYWLGPMVGVDGSQVVFGEPIVMRAISELDQQFAALGYPRAADRGLVTLRTIDCRGALADGVHVQLLNTSQGVPWVQRSGVLVSSPDSPLTTDASGLAGFYELLVGNIVFEGVATRSCSSRPMGDVDCNEAPTFGRNALTVRANTMSIAEVRPNYTYGR
jgi:hypothetical protein